VNKVGCDLRDDKLRVFNFEDINNLEEDDRMDKEGRRNNKKLNDEKGDESSSEINSLDEKRR
jgi:hypothetical protein